MFYKFLLTAKENIDKLDETRLYEYVFKGKILTKENFLSSLVQTKFEEYFQHNLLKDIINYIFFLKWDFQHLYEENLQGNRCLQTKISYLWRKSHAVV